jgi:hypothetical protein
VKDCAVAIQGVLEAFTGTLGTDGVNVGACFYIDEQDFYEEDTKLFHIAADYRIWHEE